MPWGNYGHGGGLSPFSDFNTMLDPFVSGAYDVVPRTMMPSMHRMERELGKLISSVKEDDKSFQVQYSRFVCYHTVLRFIKLVSYS